MMSNRVKLSMAQSLSPYSALDPITDSGTQSASLAQAEREIKALQEENTRLKKELAETGAAYNQLISENTHENFDERRVNFLKAQIIQLERQLLLFSEALSSRASCLLDVENSLAAITNVCRSYAGRGGTVGEVGVAKEDVIRIMETSESSRIKLYKNIENTNPESLERPLVMFDRFLQTRAHKPATLLDVCSGTLEHLNLKHVSKLESQLSQVYKQLMLVSKSLNGIAPVQRNNMADEVDVKTARKAANQKISAMNTANQEVPKAAYVRLGAQVSRACNMLKDVTSELLALSVLIPAAPWPALKKPLLKDLNTQAVMSKFNGIPRSKVGEVKQVVDSLIKAINYSNLVANAETKALKEEVKFHQEVYHQQKYYMDGLLTALRHGYSDFQEGTYTMICEPLTEILRVYETLKTTASEDALKYFLKVFKEHAEDISEAVKNLSDHLKSEEGQEAISSHGAQLFMTLDTICRDHQQKRDNLLNDLDIVQEQYKQYKAELTESFFVEKIPANDSAMEKSIDNEPDRFENSNNKDPRLENSNNKDVSSKRTTKVTPRKESKNVPKGETKHVDVDDVPCNCGAEHDSSISSIDISPPMAHQHRKPLKATSKPPAKTSTEQNFLSNAAGHSDTTKGDVEKSQVPSYKPPKPVKGVPQSRLVLKKKKSARSNENDSNGDPKDEDFRGQSPSMRKSESSPNVAARLQSPMSMYPDEVRVSTPSSRNRLASDPYGNENSGHSEIGHPSESDTHGGYQDATAYPREARPRSGSLSRIGSRAQRVSHLEPLLSAMPGGNSVTRRSSTGKPWK